ncbi:PAS domain S-box protein [Spirosoma foliorum]|uniref:Sensory/regulatory protein RpfC n=1 Tax=Spirosoma foliorum TaxID=2710596 RepID=A0A7G5H1B3_9BACT|nr:PAS domain S-box protein [Spirosoma foliorum]QMW04905.1 PAS domain S-box protein [Spirosoma foliorum]
MAYSKLLTRQISRYLTSEFDQVPEMIEFLEAVDRSYLAFERDRELTEQAFSISEKEYSALHTTLKQELEIKKLSVQKLEEAVNAISGVNLQTESNDLLSIARFLHQQINQRKNAEKVFTSLITNMENGILLEDENRAVVFTNQVFCELFSLPVSPEALQGVDCTHAAEASKDLFNEPEQFVRRIDTILSEKKLIKGEILELANGSVYQRDYIPLFIDHNYKGHLWSYTDITQQKKSRDALEQSELKNRLIMNGALDAIITIDIEGIITFWNPQAEEIFGWTSQEALGQKLSDLIIPAVHQGSHIQGLRSYTQTREGRVLGKTLELPALNRAKKTFPIELYIIPLKQGENEFFCSFIRDISERKKYESELEKLSLVASANNNGVIFVDLSGKIFWVNEGFQKLTQYNFNQVSGKVLFDICQGQYTDVTSRVTIEKAFNKGQSFTLEGIYYRQDKSWFWARISGQPIIDKQQAITQYFFIVEDISQEKSVQRQLKEYEEKLRMALTNVGDNYWEHDFRSQKTYFSNPSSKVLGFPIDETTDLAGLWWRQVHSADRSTLEENDNLYRAGLQTHHSLEYRMIHKDGSISWVLDRGVVTEQDTAGTPLKIIGTHINITHQKELEIALKVAKEAAEESTRSKELFLANMSHEIRTPMNAIMGMSNQLKKTSLTEQQQFYLNTIQAASDNLLVIINDILDLSKIEAGKLTIEQIGFEPHQLIKKVLQIMSHRAEEKGLLFTNSLLDTQIAPVLIGDPHRLTQILLNLISNAIKFTDKGRVDIRCQVVEEDATQQTIQATVQDTGIGMDDEFVRTIFQTFSQEDTSISRRFGGTGLGMSICKNLVDLMGGKIEVKSQKQVGTTVSFSIPFNKGESSHLPQKQPEQINTDFLSGSKILVVDDNEMNRLLASTILKNYGALIDEARNGLEALEKLKAQPYNLVLMDVHMPIMDGLEATKQIREKIKAQLPIIALTALAVSGDREKFIRAGMNDYLSKPFDESILLAVVAKWLGKDSVYHSTTSETEIRDGLFDLSGLRSIAQGDEEFVWEMVSMFIDLVPAGIKEMKTAYEANDFKKVSQIAHRLHPSVATLNIKSLADVLVDIDKNAETYQANQRLEGLITGLDEVIKAVVDQLVTNASTNKLS